jgi:hypothetical protein
VSYVECKKCGNREDANAEQGKKRRVSPILAFGGFDGILVDFGARQLDAVVSSSSSAESRDLYGIVSGISSATLYASVSASASATEDWPRSSSSRLPSTSPSDAARRSPRPRDAKTDPRRGEPMGEDIGERARGSPREARAKVGKPRRRIGASWFLWRRGSPR